MKLSIIVPVYNVEAYLKKCVDSLLDQDIPVADYEIILVDDGSLDASGQICDQYAGPHENIRVIHQSNAGLSVARNTGIASAKGEYIQFVDSDDYLEPNVLNGILSRLENDRLDVLRINYQNVREDGGVFEPNKTPKPFADYSTVVCDGLTFLNERLGFTCYAVQFVVKASILQQEGNGFNKGIYYEDVEWTPRILLQANRVASSPVMVYNYLYRQDSITRNINYGKRRKAIKDKLSLVSFLGRQGEGLSDRRWFDGMAAQMILSVLAETARSFYPVRKQIIREIKTLEVFPLSTYHCTGSSERKIRMVNISPELFCIVLHLKERLFNQQ